MINVKQIVAVLDQLNPVELRGLQLLTELENGTEPLSAEALIELSPELDQACQQTEQLATLSQRVVLRCLALKPVPGPQIPLGF